MAGERPVWLAEDVGVEQPAVVGALDQADADRHVELAGERHRFHGGGAVRDGFGERTELLPTQIAHMPVAGDAHLGKGEDFNTRGSGFERKTLDDGKVVGLVVGAVMELHCPQLEPHLDPFPSAAMPSLAVT